VRPARQSLQPATAFGLTGAIGVDGVIGAIGDAPLFLELLFPLDDKARE
jgi:hypothetical protein